MNGTGRSHPLWDRSWNIRPTKKRRIRSFLSRRKERTDYAAFFSPRVSKHMYVHIYAPLNERRASPSASRAGRRGPEESGAADVRRQ